MLVDVWLNALVVHYQGRKLAGDTAIVEEGEVPTTHVANIGVTDETVWNEGTKVIVVFGRSKLRVERAGNLGHHVGHHSIDVSVLHSEEEVVLDSSNCLVLIRDQLGGKSVL